MELLVLLLVCTGLLGLLLKDMQLTTQAEALSLQGKTDMFTT